MSESEYAAGYRRGRREAIEAFVESWRYMPAGVTDAVARKLRPVPIEPGDDNWIARPKSYPYDWEISGE